MPNSIRVIHALPGATVGGAEVQVLRLSNALEALGVDVCVYFGQPGGRLDTSSLLDDVDVVVDKPGGLPARIARLWRFIGTWEADIVHVHMSPAAYLASRMHSGVRTVAHVHTAFNPRRKMGIRQRLSRLICQGDVTVACSEAAREDYLNTSHLKPDDIHVIYNGIDFAAFDNEASSTPESPVDLDDGKFLFAATKLGWAKGTDVLLTALGQLGDRDDWQLVVIGESSKHEEYVQMCEGLGIIDRISFLGLRSLHDIPWILSQCDCFTQVSRLEGLGIAIIEASAARLPVIATRVGGIPEVVQHGQTGILIPSENVRALADALLLMLDHRDEARTMGLHGREHVERKFNIEEIALTTAGVYEELLR